MRTKLVTAAVIRLEVIRAVGPSVHLALGRKSDNMARIFGEDATRAIVARNRTLMNLRLPAPCWDELDALTTRGAWDKAAFVAWYAEQRISAVEQATLLDRLEALAASQ